MATTLTRHSGAGTARTWKRGLTAEWAASETGREARFYTLTKLGRKQLEEQRANWDRLSTAISGILSTAD